MRKLEDPEQVHLVLERELIAQVDDWRYQNRIPSRTAAVRELIRNGLKMPPASGKPEPVRRRKSGD